MLMLTCHCGLVRIHLEERPDFINECNCTLCSKVGARWAYFHPSAVRADGPTKGFTRDDKADPAAEVHFCPACSVTTHFILTPGAQAKFGNTLMGINMRLADEGDLAGIELRYPDGAAWSGEGDFTYLRAARIIGDDATPD